MVRPQFYDLADPLTPGERRRFKAGPAGARPGGYQVRAVVSGTPREIKRGEWYISGAVPEAYRARGNMTDRRVPAMLVLTAAEACVHVVEE